VKRKDWNPRLRSLPTNHFRSTDSLIEEDKDNLTIQLTDNKDFRDEIDKKLISNGLKEIVETLSERESKILIQYFGLFGEEQMTLDKVGNLFRISRERVRQILDKAIGKLKSDPRREKIVIVLENTQLIK